MDEAQPVKIVDQEKPVSVVVEDTVKKPKLISKGKQAVLAPTTTEQEDITHAGQRRINLIWEFTQALIAISITGAVEYCTISGIDAPVLTNAFFLVVSMYLIRTNHKLIGGVGSNYQGR